MKQSLFLLVAAILSACSFSKNDTEVMNTPPTEPYRPFYHFTPPAAWMNDPNGMVWFDGEYHLFYQHYPDSTVWGPMHWGHAVSKDMIHWEHLPIALYPDSLGYIFSGSAVVDHRNTSGFGTKESPAMVAIYTYHDMDAEKQGKTGYQTQGIAWSTDRGRTWNKYEGNPVLTSPAIKDFRDPKVMWHEPSGKWIMALAVGDHIEFYASPDLKKWTKQSEIGQTFGAHGGVWECPDLFALKDAKGKEHWVLLVSINPGGPQGGSATQYFIGSFDGSKFTPYDTEIRWIDYGADNYAGVTWSDVPSSDGRRLFLGWMSNWQYSQVVPTTTWRSAMTVPREVKLLERAGYYELQFIPVEELNGITKELRSFDGEAVLKAMSARISFKATSTEPFRFILSNDSSEQAILKWDGTALTFDRTIAGKSDFNEHFAAVHAADMRGVDLREVTIFLDQASIEVFINNGERVLTEIVFPTQPYTKAQLEKKDPSFIMAPIPNLFSKP